MSKHEPDAWKLMATINPRVVTIFRDGISAYVERARPGPGFKWSIIGARLGIVDMDNEGYATEAEAKAAALSALAAHLSRLGSEARP